MIGTGRDGQRDTVLGLGAYGFVDTGSGTVDDVGPVDLVFDIFGGEILERSVALVRPGGTVVTIAGEAAALPQGGRSVGFVVEADRGQLAEIARRVQNGRLWAPAVEGRPLSEAPKLLAAPRQGPRTVFVPDGR